MTRFLPKFAIPMAPSSPRVVSNESGRERVLPSRSSPDCVMSAGSCTGDTAQVRAGGRVSAAVALVLGLAAAIIGIGMLLTVFFIPLGVPVLAYAWVRLIWAVQRLLGPHAPRRTYQLNVAAGVLALAAYGSFAVALWPGRPDGYIVGGLLATAELMLVVAAWRAAALMRGGGERCRGECEFGRHASKEGSHPGFELRPHARGGRRAGETAQPSATRRSAVVRSAGR